MAASTHVISNGQRIDFLWEGGDQLCRVAGVPRTKDGTRVYMEVPLDHTSVERLENYFAKFIVPMHIMFRVNSTTVPFRAEKLMVPGELPTEVFKDSKWLRRPRRTTVALVPTWSDETPMVYEMGIPICPVGWDLPYHADVQQRVPMNPNRDAVASGYLLKLHTTCLPVMLDLMDSEQARADWVGAAAPHCDHAAQRMIIEKGFGPLNALVRSTPKMGVRQFDEDARDKGLQVLDTRQTSSGFGQVLRELVPSSRDAVVRMDREERLAAASRSFDPILVFEDIDPAAERQRKLIEQMGGPARVTQACDFFEWFCQQLVDGYGDGTRVRANIAAFGEMPGGRRILACWADDAVVTFGIDTAFFWHEPFGEEALTTCIHEAAHHLNQHHGRDFHIELERLAGRAARLMLLKADYIRERWPNLMPTDA